MLLRVPLRQGYVIQSRRKEHYFPPNTQTREQKVPVTFIQNTKGNWYLSVVPFGLGVLIDVEGAHGFII